MEKIPISKFKVDCLAIIRRVGRTRKSVLITRFGEPIAEIVPASPVSRSNNDWLGSLAGTGRIVGDIVGPASKESDWEFLC